ncbi:DNA helicase-2/ATP-dependent DNA helicase PcrA [Anaerosolibacter carboniphilus]|uniref:DNA 3'-5' helicase n=1 Tax=Anaerosolibacter carboniphilus TaxID=1417629 RepID=A0A841KQD9_9FIRM|nr:3'-5' exonuclease [Anaerosolibacter carboniphilus]MBB6214328.1 DNA helicase-2/ATP-dependent DNA helicase PcrA [Anaerosolibacter carboniphilus]
MNRTEKDERQYLHEILKKLKAAYQSIDQKISGYANEIQETKKYIWENNAQLDLAEKAANRIAVHELIDFGEKAIVQKQKIAKLINSPYFGRIDFRENGEIQETPFYIGMHSFEDESDKEVLIYDWRAPISSMFYDFEMGNAYYTAPIGRICGDICLKRQYKIKDSHMEYMLESALNIGDDVLQKELSRTSDEKMKNIVATIQREQNSIIRNERSEILIIQGVAGSGKTSIALHRVAFLLYRFKEQLTSKDILIISPNKVFSDYISNVLPELGEEEIIEMDMEEIASNEMVGRLDFQSFSQQVADLMRSEDSRVIERIRYKAALDFVRDLDLYLEKADTEYFSPTDICIEGINVSKEYLMQSYTALKRMPVKKRLEKMAQDIIEKRKTESGKKIKSPIAKKVKTAVLKMYKFKDTLSLYKNFYHHIGKPELFQLIQKDTLEYADVFPYMYTKMFFEGMDTGFEHVKHLLVDEMQDYTPIQYAVIKKLFHCKMTILGDSFQSVNPHSASSLEVLKNVFGDAECMELRKSYRSTIEITNFAQKIKSNSKLVPIERYGEEPTIRNCATSEGQSEEIRHLISDYVKSSYNSLGILCKTQEQAVEIYQQVKDKYNDVYLLDFGSTELKDGITITTAHMAKGLEFDQVIVPSVCSDIYHTDLDRSMLYVACTRAMHRLDLTYCGELTHFLC